MDQTADELIARLRRNPDDAGAFASLRAHYHRMRDYASLANLLEGYAARQRDAQASSGAYFEAGELVLGALGDRNRAIALYERALERNAVHVDASLRLEELFQEMGDDRRLADILERRAEALGHAQADPRHTAAVHHQLGELWEQRFQRVDRAIFHYRKAFELDPSLVAAIYAAREIYRNAGNLKAAAAHYDLEINAEADPQRRVALLREVAHLRAERLSDVEGAVVALKRALGLAPGDFAVMSEMAAYLRRRAERAQSSDAAANDRRRAADLFYQMAQQVPAIEALAYTEQALDVQPDHDGAMQLLETLAQQTGRQDMLPPRWVAFLTAAPDAPTANEMRRRLGFAYLEAGQVEDAILCFEPLLEAGDSQAAEALVELYRNAGRHEDVSRALTVAVDGLPPEKRIPRLREIIQILIAGNRREEAATRAREILALDPADPEALAFLEDDCRRRNDWTTLRDLLLAAARVPGLSVESRKLRLREVAGLSEKRLEDVDGAISAWRAVATLDPADAEAREALKRLLEKVQRWDELVQVLEREALSTVDPDAKSEIYRRLAELHRDRRSDLAEAIEALRHLRELRPGDLRARDDLCDALVQVGAHLEAVPLLRQRIEAAMPGELRQKLLGTLAWILEEHIGDDEGSFEACARLLDEEPGDIESLERMERIDVRNERWDRLIVTLGYRGEVAGTPEERAGLFSRMGQLADTKLGDLERAAEYYRQALDHLPSDAGILDALCEVFDRAQRYRDLVQLLRERATAENDVGVRAELYRRIARTLADRVRNEDGAAEAWQEVLAAGDDEEALRYLSGLARKRDEPEKLEMYLGRMIAIASTPPGERTGDLEEKRDLALERATLLAERLDRKPEAIGVLREVVTGLDPQFLPAIQQLAALCEETGDKLGLADALERQLAAIEDAGLRVPVAQKLSDLYELELDDKQRAIAALYAWADADLTDTEPHRRLLPLLEGARRFDDLLASLDALAGIEQEDGSIGALVLRAAEVSLRDLGDVDGAWDRLEPRVLAGDAAAEEQLRRVAREAARGEALAELYVRMAQSATESAEQQKRWADAAAVYEDYLGDPGRALEAVLRAFAVDLGETKFLAEADRLAAAAQAWPRLTQVYETLLRRAGPNDAKVQLLLRQAAILEGAAGDAGSALDRVLRACSLDPNDDEVLVRAEELAPKAGRADELLIVYDRRRAQAADDPARIDALVRAARLCDGALGDRQRAFHYVAQAAALSVRQAELGTAVEDAVRAMDEARPEIGPYAARTQLVDVYRKLADDAGETQPEVSGTLLLRAARVLAEELENPEEAFEVLAYAASVAPNHPHILDELEDFAEKTGRLETLDGLFAKLVDEALDSRTAAELLKRRGRILEVELERYSAAAEVFNQLAVVSPHDPEVPRRLRACLRAANQHQDLLVVLDRELERARDPEKQVAILKEIAATWETDLKNRWEALDAWKRVLALLPEDAEAGAAVKRLGHSTRKLTARELADLDSSERELEDHSPGPEEEDSIIVPDLPVRPSEPPLPGAPGAERSGEFTDPGVAAPEDDGEPFERRGFGGPIEDITDPGEDESISFVSPPLDRVQREVIEEETTGLIDDAGPIEEEATEPPQPAIFGSIGAAITGVIESDMAEPSQPDLPPAASVEDAEEDMTDLGDRAEVLAQMFPGAARSEPAEPSGTFEPSGVLEPLDPAQDEIQDDEIEELAADDLLDSAESLDEDEIEDLPGESEAPRMVPMARPSAPPPPPPPRPSQAAPRPSVPPPPVPVPRRR